MTLFPNLNGQIGDANHHKFDHLWIKQSIFSILFFLLKTSKQNSRKEGAADSINIALAYSLNSFKFLALTKLNEFIYLPLLVVCTIVYNYCVLS